jgi:cytochrome P450/NADPH-cytochrome P450 reductase
LGRYHIRKGDVILVGTLAAQRDPRYWGENPGEFDPEQFAMEKVVERPRHAFIPFSIGKRQCMAQEVTFMMLRVVLFEIYKRYRLRLAPGAAVTKNTVVTTKPVAVPVVRVPRQLRRVREETVTRPERPAVSRPVPAAAPAVARDWGAPTEIPVTSPYRRLEIANGSNYGACKELAERFAERGRFYGYEPDVLTLNELAGSAPRGEPWLQVVVASTYTSNPPANAAAFKSWLEHAEPEAGTWRQCKYLVWGLGNSQWNAFLAFPRYVHRRLAELGAEPLADFAYGDVGSPAWETVHADWNSRVWPVLLELSEAVLTEAAEERVTAEREAAREFTRADSTTAMAMSLGREATASRALLAPTILTNAVGADTIEGRARGWRERPAAPSSGRTGALESGLPRGGG